MTDTDRNITLGGGPFQPPSPTELATLRSQNERQAVTIERLTERLDEQNRRLAVTTPDDLTNLLSYVLDATGVFVDSDDESLTIRVPDLTIRDGEIVPPRQDFTVSAEITFEVNATVEAADEDEARDLFAAALDSALLDLDVDLEPYDGVESSYTTDADIGYISAYEG